MAWLQRPEAKQIRPRGHAFNQRGRLNRLVRRRCGKDGAANQIRRGGFLSSAIENRIDELVTPGGRSIEL